MGCVSSTDKLAPKGSFLIYANFNLIYESDPT